MLGKALSKVIYGLFPTLCQNCGRPLQEEECLFCHNCLFKLPIAKSYCRRCGSLLSESLLDFFDPHTLNYCSHCERENLPYERVFIGFLYREPIKSLIHRAKFREDFILAYQLGKLLKKLSPVNVKDYDYVLPIPLSLKREQERGYNQSLLLLWGLMGFHLPKKILWRIRHTRPQSELSGKERKENVKNVFECREDLSGKKILLVDDIMTTGATLKEASKVLKKKGAKEVHLLVLARA